MKVFKLLYVLYKMGISSPLGLYRLTSGALKYGINLMTLLYFAEETYGDNIALVDEHEALNYRQLFSQAERLSKVLKEKYQLKQGQRVGFLCKNHASLVKAVFAVSLSGADIFLLNAEMSGSQFSKLLDRYDFDLLIYDFELSSLIDESRFVKPRILSCHDELPAINNLVDTEINKEIKLERATMGKIVIMTSGTTGDFKEAIHKPSIFNFLNPFTAVLNRLKLLIYNTAYIATPIYHGYGLAVLLLFFALGRKVVINRGFDAKKACSLIRENSVEIVTVVPLMIHKMLRNNAEDLKSLACIASGGAELNPRLVDETFNKLGDVLYNLYGTSEAGLNIIATPQDLKYSPSTIGRKIKGARIKILNEDRNEVGTGKVGQICIKNKWSMKNSTNSWIETGDLGYQDSKGYYFVWGRVDDMIVSAGENVYPLEVEQVLKKHPQVEEAAVIGVSDEIFGHRLKAFVLLSKGANTTTEELFEWLRSRVARFQLPKDITFVDHLPYTALGKLDKKKLI